MIGRNIDPSNSVRNRYGEFTGSLYWPARDLNMDLTESETFLGGEAMPKEPIARKE